MALSGTINGTTSNSGIKSRIEWSAVQDINANTSTITAKGILYWTSNLQTWGTGTYYMSIDGVQGNNTVYAEISYNSNTVVITYTRTVSHNADGTKSLALDFSGGISGTTLTSIDCQGTITLDTIPRASSFSIPSSVNMGSNLSVSITRASSSFTHDVKLTFNGQTVSASNVGTSATLAVPIGWASRIPNATSGTGAVTVTTKNGGTTIGTTSKNITVAVPSSVVPTLTLATALVTGYSGLYLQGVSKCKLTGTAAGVYGSTIRSISYSGAGYTGSGTTYTTGVLNVTGDITFTATATDSRGRTVTKQAKITVIAYNKPSISNYSAQRCNSGGTLQVDGTYLSVRATFSCASVNGKNAVSCNVSYKKSTAGAWSGTTALTSNAAKVIGGSITLNEFWQVRFVVQDSVGTSLGLAATTVTTDIPTSAYRAVFGEDRSGFGQYPEGAGAWFAYPVHADSFIGTLTGNASTSSESTKVARLNQMLEDSTASDLTALMHRKVDLIRQIANGQDGVYCIHAGWSGHGWGFTIGAHYAGANVTDAVFFQGAEIDTIRKNGNNYGAVQVYKP
jgi:hypothetical protein